MPKKLPAATSRQRLTLLSVASLLVLTMQQPVSAANATITIDNFTFSPATLNVARGTTVTWMNRDDSPHRVAGVKGEFQSPALDTDDKFSYTFTTAGSAEYFCTIHPHMTGKIIVTP